MGRKTRWSPAGTWICQCTHIHYRTNRAKKKQTDGQIQMSGTYTRPLCNHNHRVDNGGNPLLPACCKSSLESLASSPLNEQVAWGRVQETVCWQIAFTSWLVAEPSWAAFQGIVIAFYSLEQPPHVMYPSSCRRHLVSSGLFTSPLCSPLCWIVWLSLHCL